jgi:hypothetical protein
MKPLLIILLVLAACVRSGKDIRITEDPGDLTESLVRHAGKAPTEAPKKVRRLPPVARPTATATAEPEPTPVAEPPPAAPVKERPGIPVLGWLLIVLLVALTFAANPLDLFFNSRPRRRKGGRR